MCVCVVSSKKNSRGIKMLDVWSNIADALDYFLGGKYDETEN